MAEKQPQLNGAYYGPSIPAQKSYHSHGRSSGCGCGCCLLTLLLKIIISAAIIIGLAVLIFWLIFRPNPVKFHVTDASLTEFNLTADNTLHYNLALNITVRNPNKKIGIYYDSIEASAYYEDQRLNTVPLTRFYQGHKNTSYLRPVFQGQKVLVGVDEVSEFNEEKSGGVYSIDVKLNLRVRFRLAKIKVGKFKPRVVCDIKVPLKSSGNVTTVAGTFQTTRCEIDLF